MIQHDITTAGPHRWKKGETGNAKGRPPGARQRIAEKLIADIAEVWEACGQDVLKRLAVEDPAKLAQIAYGLVPKDIFLNVAQAAPGGLEPDEWATLRRVLDIVQATAPDGAPPSLIFETIENALRAEFAHPIQVLALRQAAPAVPPPPY